MRDKGKEEERAREEEEEEEEEGGELEKDTKSELHISYLLDYLKTLKENVFSVRC